MPLLELDGVSRDFDVSRPWLNRVLEHEPRRYLRAVDQVSLAIEKGETLALVGESGCGKSTVARLIVGLYQPSAGRVAFAGRRMQMIFQDPYASLNPRWRVRDIVAEPIRFLGTSQNVDQLLRQVGLDAQQLLLVVPLIDGLRLVEALVALETDQARAGDRRARLGEL